MKTRLIIVLCAVSWAGMSSAQVATVDANSIPQLVKMTEAVTQLQNQLEQMKKQYSAMTGESVFGGYGGNSAYDAAQKFPKNWDDVYGSGNAYDSEAQQTLDQLDQQTDNMSPTEAMAFTRERMRLNNAHDRAVMQKVYDDQQAEMTNLNDLQQQIPKAVTQKQISDLQARINVSQGTINAQQMRMQNMASLQEAQHRMYQDQEGRAIDRKMVGDSSGSAASPDPLN